MEYVALIHKEEEEYVAVVPDLNYTSSFGTTFADAVHNIIEASELYCEDLEKLPKASSFESLVIEDGAIPQLINIHVEKNVRINIMMPSDLLREIDHRASIAYKSNRSAYLQDLARRDVIGA